MHEKPLHRSFAIVAILCFSLQIKAFRPIIASRQSINARLTSMLSEQKTDVGDKLVFDTKMNRFYEAMVDAPVQEEFCLVDSNTGEKILLTKEEKERIFLDSIQSYYFSGNSTLSDVEFSQLRDDLSWEGSPVVTMNRNETLFVNAIMAWNKGESIMPDKEFDDLKASLKSANSMLAVSTEPKCYVDTGVCKVTWQPDQIRTASLYIPASAFLTVLYLGILYEIPFIRYVFNPIILLLIGIFPIFQVTKEITENFLFRDPFIAYGPCPSCGVENKIFFGDVLGVEGDPEEGSLKCTNCKKPLTVRKSTLRVSTLPPKAPGPPPKKAKIAAPIEDSDDA